MKKILRILFILVFIGFIFAELFIFPVIDLTNKDDRKTLNIIYASEILEVEHSINYLIPFGKDYYYVGIDENDDAYLIHAPKKWAEKNFSEDSENILEITALSKEISDYEIERELYSRVNQIEELTFPLGSSQCLELTYVRDSIMKIATGLFALILTLIGILNSKRIHKLSQIAVKIYAGAVLICIVLLLIAII
ncbi:MAG: hypothetical protein K2J37_02160 [Ruminococcus sp.]|nr:hypothetical protein [Ruminococcus sp.]